MELDASLHQMKCTITDLIIGSLVQRLCRIFQLNESEKHLKESVEPLANYRGNSCCLPKRDEEQEQMEGWMGGQKDRGESTRQARLGGPRGGKFLRLQWTPWEESHFGNESCCWQCLLRHSQPCNSCSNWTVFSLDTGFVCALILWSP